MNDNLKTIKLSCLNCAGIGNKTKRNNVFKWLKSNYEGIIFLQETHSTEYNENIWEKEWGGKILFNHGEYNARGVAILISNNLDTHIEYINTFKDKNGRILLLNCKIYNTSYTIINIYCPTKDNLQAQKQFIENIRKVIEEHSETNIIIGGDLNTYLDITKDKKGGTLEKQSTYANDWNNICNEFSLTDIWRVRNPDKRYFTRRQNSKKGIVQSRLDYWLISTGIAYLIKEVNIKPSYGSDHSILTMEMKIINTDKRGRGYWKFSNSLLTDIEYVNIIKQTINKLKNEVKMDNKNMLWEYLKCQMRTDTIIYAISKSKQERKHFEELEKKIDIYEKTMNNDELIHLEYKQLKQEWQNIINKRNNGIKIRAKAKYVEEGEKNTKYFLNLEKMNYNSTHIKLLLDEKGNEITNRDEILEQEKSFYQNLYTSKLNTNRHRQILESNFTQINNIPQLTETEQDI